jgi:hypothetical protein
MVRNITNIFLLIICSIIIISCQKFRKLEEQYQADADIIRIHHFDYYAKLLSEYYEKNGKYPFQYEKEEQVYIYILNNIQEEKFKDTNPYIYYRVNDKIFFEELSKGLEIEIDEKYDPQKAVSDRRPNYYIYMVDGDNFYFAIHLYNNNYFTKNVDKYYNKMELSNIDSKQYTLFTYETLKNDPKYIELANRKVEKQDFFDGLDNKYKNDSKY